MARSKWSANKYKNLKVYFPTKTQMKKNRRYRDLAKKAAEAKQK